MKHLYQAEFLSQKLPSEEEFNKQFSKKYCGFIFFMEKNKRFYHRLDSALPIGYDTEYYGNSSFIKSYFPFILIYFLKINFYFFHSLIFNTIKLLL